MRNYGNYVHNCKVLEEGKGVLIPFRSPSEQVDASLYIPCEHCLGFFLKKDLWRHQQVCSFKPDVPRKGRKVISRAQMLLPSKAECSSNLKEKIFSKMKSDEVTMAARNDPLIVALTRLSEKLYQIHLFKLVCCVDSSLILQV